MPLPSAPPRWRLRRESAPPAPLRAAVWAVREVGDASPEMAASAAVSSRPPTPPSQLVASGRPLPQAAPLAPLPRRRRRRWHWPYLGRLLPPPHSCPWWAPWVGTGVSPRPPRTCESPPFPPRVTGGGEAPRKRAGQPPSLSSAHASPSPYPFDSPSVQGKPQRVAPFLPPLARGATPFPSWVSAGRNPDPVDRQDRPSGSRKFIWTR